MIPKKIHYCWFGRGEKSKLAKKCIASWEKYCPDYEIIEWNEDNFDVESYPYASWCLEHKKYAFLSDFARLIVVERYGGLYLDTDVEVVRGLDDLLQEKAFFGFENAENVNTGQGFGAEIGNEVVRAMSQEYLRLQPNDNGDYQIEACPKYNTLALETYGLVKNGETQTLAGIKVFSSEYFNPYDDAKGVLRKTPNTYSIHWYSKSWIDKKQRFISILTKPFHRIFGKNCFDWLKRKK